MAFPSGWARRAPLTIQSSKVSGTQTNFPVLLTEANLPSEMFDADGSFPAINGGDDIRFSSDIDGNVQLSAEIVTFQTDNNPALGRAEIWVKAPSINSSTDVTIYVWYSKPGELPIGPTDPFGSHSVWDSNYLMVVHMKQTPSGANSVLDSTSNGYHFSPTGSFSTNPDGKIGKSVDFTNSPYLTKTDVNPQLRPANLTVQMWATVDTYATFDVLAMKTNGGSWTLGWGLDFRGSTQLRMWINHFSTAGNGVNVNPTGSLLPKFYAGKYNGSQISLQMDNNAPVTVAYSTPISYDSDNIHLGFHTGGNALDGRMDEFRLSNIARSDAWLVTDYNCQNDPATFVIAGTPVAPGVNADFTYVLDKSNREVTFTDASSESAISWTWNFGDPGSGIDNTSTDQNPTHIFSADGIYTVTLQVSDGEDTDEEIKQLTVAIIIADFSFSRVGDKEVDFSDTSIGDNIISWSWDFGDSFGTNNQNPSHEYLFYNTYPVELIIENSLGLTDSIIQNIDVNQFIADFTTTLNGLEATFIDLSVGSPNDYLWNFGDPDSGIDNTSTDQNPIHIFSTPGHYVVTLTINTGSLNDSTQKSVATSEFVGIPEQLDSTKLTFETDDDRRIVFSTAVEDQDERKIVFYQKDVISGRLSNGRVQDAGGLNVSVAAGNGIVNSIPVSWGFTNIAVQPNQFQLVYVTTGGVVSITDNFDMTLTASVILLAYVFAGATGITRLLEIEKDGKYIYVRRQQPDGFGGYIWDNYEDILNSGTEPHAVFNILDNRIYLTYKKDSAVYQRIIEVGNEANAWEYLLDYNIQSGPQIVLGSDPLTQIEADSSSSDMKSSTADPFTFSTLILGFKTEFQNPGYDFTHKYLFMPNVKSIEILDGTELEIENYNIYTGSDILQNLVDSFDYQLNKHTWKNIDSLDGVFYLGWSGYLKIFGRKIPYTLPIDSRLKITIQPDFFDLNGADTESIIGKAHQSTDYVKSSSSDAKNDILTTFEQIIDFETDGTLEEQDKLSGSSSDNSSFIINTFEQAFDFETDNELTQQDKLSGSSSDLFLGV